MPLSAILVTYSYLYLRNVIKVAVRLGVRRKCSSHGVRRMGGDPQSPGAAREPAAASTDTNESGHRGLPCRQAYDHGQNLPVRTYSVPPAAITDLAIHDKPGPANPKPPARPGRPQGAPQWLTLTKRRRYDTSR